MLKYSVSHSEKSVGWMEYGPPSSRVIGTCASAKASGAYPKAKATACGTRTADIVVSLWLQVASFKLKVIIKDHWFNIEIADFEDQNRASSKNYKK